MKKETKARKVLMYDESCHGRQRDSIFYLLSKNVIRGLTMQTTMRAVKVVVFFPLQ